MRNQNMVLTSSQPINDGGRKLNMLYLALGGIGFVVGLIMGGFESGLLFAVIGAVIAFAVKNLMCQSKVMGMRTYSFSCDKKIGYDEMIQGLQPNLMPLGMTIEKNKDGHPVISYKGMKYEVLFEDNQNAFNIWWSVSIGMAFLTSNYYIGEYRKASVAYGIIGYYVQQLCK
ncbi:hypothetical protein [Butyrivibrio fibrisolvens]|uniref:hypothetical protein n=1 Tax=Butyrivibrio fibrisolvens TaxID=831 RepID=UPI0004836837|nr:hypothetical protein [Butyrivibrio fibrisolvens]